ncbi:LuxR family transcriptional regulator [Thermosyntropha lipolytica]|nr:PocR ligand-binding domain-containing protein [Thermosyntropha lipolytica]
MREELRDCREGCQFIKRIGKESIQALQDSLSEMLNMSFCLWDSKGNRLTVWSNSSLFCYTIISKNKERCKKQKQNIISQVREKKEPVVATCYMGMTFFSIPILYQEELIAIFYGGGFVLGNKTAGSEYISRLGYNIPVISELQLNNTINFLEKFFSVLKREVAFYEYSDDLKISREETDIFLLHNHLSLRELEIAKLVLAGMSNKEIANYLGISEKTVKVHVGSILKKLQLKDRKQLIIFCQQQLGKR